MKKYIFLAFDISGIGGGQLYLSTKSNWLIDRGYDINIFTMLKNEKIKGDFSGVSAYNLQQLNVNPQSLSRRKVDETIKYMAEKVDASNYDEIIIESLSIQLSMWGELLAQKLSGKHIIFSISESNKISVNEVPFIEYKCSRKEIASINPDFFYGLYERSKVVSKSSITKLVAHMGNQVKEYASKELEKVSLAEINICVFGRLSKQYVIDSINEIIAFAQSYRDKKIVVVYVGEASNENQKKRMLEKYQGQKNIKAFFIGELNPIPKKLFSMFDVIIGGAGCANIAYRNGATTIAMDVTGSGLPLGILGYDVETSFSKSDNTYSLHEFLYKVIIEGYGKNWKPCNSVLVEWGTMYEPHISFINESEKKKEYYNCLDIRLSLRERLIDMLCFVLGNRSEAYAFIKNFKRKRTLKSRII